MEENAEASAKEAGGEGEEDAASTGKNSDGGEKEDVEGNVEDAVKSEDVAKASASSVDQQVGKKNEKTEGSNEKDLGFHIKTYEEILREKALRKMLERRQQLQINKDSDDTSEVVHKKSNDSENKQESIIEDEGRRAMLC